MNDAVRLAIPQVGLWEGRIAWLYRDSRGNATVAMGKMLATLMDAYALPFCCHAPGEDASKGEIEADWQRVMAMPFGRQYGARFYRSPESVFLTPSVIDSLAIEQLTECDNELRRDFPVYDQLPLLAKVAMLDMDYNLGETKLRTTYPRFDCAVDNLDYLQMAAQCHRDGISEARNEWAKKQFLLCLNGSMIAATQPPTL